MSFQHSCYVNSRQFCQPWSKNLSVDTSEDWLYFPSPCLDSEHKNKPSCHIGESQFLLLDRSTHLTSASEEEDKEEELDEKAEVEEGSKKANKLPASKEEAKLEELDDDEEARKPEWGCYIPFKFEKLQDSVFTIANWLSLCIPWRLHGTATSFHQSMEKQNFSPLLLYQLLRSLSST